MRMDQWRSLLSSHINVDSEADVKTYDQVLLEVWDYIAIQMSQRTTKEGDDSQNISRAERDRIRNSLISDYILNKAPRVEGFTRVSSSGKTKLELRRLYAQLQNTITGYDILETIMRDPTVKEIQINAEDSIWVEDDNGLHIAHDTAGNRLKFRSIRALQVFLNNLLTTSQIDDGNNKCIGNAITPEGYRIAVIGGAAMAANKGRNFKSSQSPACVIRKFSDDVITTDKLIEYLSISDQIARFNQIIGDTHASVMVGGSTGSGKTVTLQTLIDEFPSSLRVFTMEKDSELRVRKFNSEGELINNVIQTEYITEDKNVTYTPTTNTANNIFNQMLRFTPDTVILGEMRSEFEISLGITAANAGHNILGTIHTDSSEGCIARMTNALMLQQPGQQKADVMSSVCNCIDLVMIPSKMKDGSRKTLEIAEVIGCAIVDGIATPLINMIYEFRQTGYSKEDNKTYGAHYQVGKISDKLLKKWSRIGMDPEIYAFLSREVPEGGIEGTYNGKQSPFREMPKKGVES